MTLLYLCVFSRVVIDWICWRESEKGNYWSITIQMSFLLENIFLTWKDSEIHSVENSVVYFCRSAAVLQYNGKLNKLELVRIGALGIRQTVQLTPRLGTVTFVENGMSGMLRVFYLFLVTHFWFCYPAEIYIYSWNDMWNRSCLLLEVSKFEKTRLIEPKFRLLEKWCYSSIHARYDGYHVKTQTTEQ